MKMKLWTLTNWFEFGVRAGIQSLEGTPHRHHTDPEILEYFSHMIKNALRFHGVLWNWNVRKRRTNSLLAAWWFLTFGIWETCLIWGWSWRTGRRHPSSPALIMCVSITVSGTRPVKTTSVCEDGTFNQSVTVGVTDRTRIRGWMSTRRRDPPPVGRLHQWQARKQVRLGWGGVFFRWPVANSSVNGSAISCAGTLIHY